MPGALLTAANLGARYGSSMVLSNVDLHVHPGEIVTLLGANGAGKTTFLNTVTGLVQMTSGRVFYGEDDISRQTPESPGRRRHRALPGGPPHLREDDRRGEPAGSAPG